METVKVDKRTQKTPEQLETLRLAREKANAIRSEKSQVKKKVKELKELSFQKDKELVEKMEKQLQVKKEDPEPEPEVEVVKKPRPKKIVYVTDSEGEEVEVVKKPKVPHPLEKKPAEIISRQETQKYIKQLQNSRMKSMLFGGSHF